MRSRSILVDVTRAAWVLATIGLLAIGTSGLLAWVAGSIGGKAFVAGDAPGTTYSSSRCAELLEYNSSATSCRDAATSHHFDETVDSRVAAGVAGVVLLGTGVVVRRRLRRSTRPTEPRIVPTIVVPTAGLTAFGIAAVALTLEGVNRIVQGMNTGSGAYLSGAAVSAVVGGGFLVWFAGDLRHACSRQAQESRPQLA